MSEPQYMPLVEESRRTRVTFPSANGLSLVGHLYPGHIPTDSEAANSGVVMAGPMTSLKEETLPHYAAALQDAGHTVLCFDNRNFGESDGEPRAHLDTYEQVEDLKNAVSYLRSRPQVDPARLALCCVCLGAGYGLEVAALDPRVSAVALIAGGYNLTDTYVEFLGEEDFAGYLDQLADMRQRQFDSGEVQYLPAIAGPPDYAPAAMPVQEAFDYYTTAQEREAPRWENRLSAASMEHIIAFNVIGHAPRVLQPLLVVHGTTDALLPPRYAQEVYDLAPEPKRLEWIETDNHVQLYDQQPYVPQAIDHVLAFFAEHLNPASDRAAARAA